MTASSCHWVLLCVLNKAQAKASGWYWSSALHCFAYLLQLHLSNDGNPSQVAKATVAESRKRSGSSITLLVVPNGNDAVYGFIREALKKGERQGLLYNRLVVGDCNAMRTAWCMARS
jgi:hypothetical protein